MASWLARWERTRWRRSSGCYEYGDRVGSLDGGKEGGEEFFGEARDVGKGKGFRARHPSGGSRAWRRRERARQCGGVGARSRLARARFREAAQARCGGCADTRSCRRVAIAFDHAAGAARAYVVAKAFATLDDEVFPRAGAGAEFRGEIEGDEIEVDSLVAPDFVGLPDEAEADGVAPVAGLEEAGKFVV